MNALTVNVAKTFAYSVFNSVIDNKPQHVTATWAAICETLSTHELRGNKNGKAFSPAEYADGKRRGSSNVLRLNLIAVDIDNGNINVVKKYCDAQGWAYVIHTTWSHTASRECFRVVIQPSRPIHPHEWPAVWSALYHPLGAQADVMTEDLGRVFFLPSCPESGSAEKFVYISDGTTPADVDALLALHPQPITSRTK
ncbi:hypothetical protein KTQ42_15635|uniref:hypothetical protein n=1 Tax=Noviherbaspirillum sp. L7-7A TaxID=2850560 RepID=UPI001C2C66DE|nr:hypothetical protein [Noviherbaspirillum sp. L7-7A]MBV0880733.1 hypothetical protein [Noviherbaspirillum sp. L7-7A]